MAVSTDEIFKKYNKINQLEIYIFLVSNIKKPRRSGVTALKAAG